MTHAERALHDLAEPLRPSLARWRTWRAHAAIARLDHWVKNVFVLPGIVVALTLNHLPLTRGVVQRSLLGLLAVGLAASSNYVINELCDAPFDRFHPIKKNRPVPSGQVIVWLAYVEWLVLGAAALVLGWYISPWLGWDLAALLVMGCAYNLRPLRTKDVPYVDVVTEAVNNPLRLLAGWLMVTATLPPVSLLASYWLVGCYFMALKRYAEYRHLQRDGSVAKYRASLAYFTPERLLYSVVFYAAGSMLFFGAFLMRYRLELVLTFPLVALVMAVYFAMAFRPDSPAEHPEKLYRDWKLMTSTAACVACMMVCLTVDMPWLETLFPPTAPVAGTYEPTK